MEKKIFVERMLETENLTDELEDRDANFLLDWGIGKLDDVLMDVNDPETAGLKVNRLMAVLRKINRIAGSYAGKQSAELVEDLRTLEELCGEAFDQATRMAGKDSPQDFEALAANLASLTPRQVVENLCQRCDLPGKD